VAEAAGVAFEDLATRTVANTCAIFRIS